MPITGRNSAVVTLLIIASCLGASSPIASAGGSRAHPPAAASQAPVNINTASVEQLMTLSGVKRTLAEKIVEHREAQGRFKKPEDLRSVRGVGRTLWERNRARIVVR